MRSMALHRPTSTSTTCHSAGRVTAKLLLSFLALAPTTASYQQQHQPVPILPPFLGRPEPQTPSNNEHVFTLRHVMHHGVEDQTIHRRLDVPRSASTMWMESDDGEIEEDNRPLIVRSTPMQIQRLKDRRPSVIDPMVAAAREEGGYWALSPSAWTMDNLAGPDVTDKETVVTFAQMAANAYVETPDTGDWKDVNGGFNRTDDIGFGWDGDGLRGYLYADETNSTVVIGLKGTSLAIWSGDGTASNDKDNDNLFFSCCCGQQVGSLARQVCDCATGTYTCNVSCLKKSLTKENRYYASARYLFNNVTALYPNANVWMAGHSLGGSLSAMIGLTYGIPVLTFQAVPDALPSSRLGLPIPPGVDPTRPGQRDYTGAYHFGHTADPVYMGTCNGATATCSFAGYAFESACHSGRECVYDVVKDNGTRVSIFTHRIIRVIADVIKTYESVPECKFTPECYDCPKWKEVEGNSTATTSSTSSSTKTRTRTSTCKTPGWWGCLDETTTSSAVTSTSSTTTTTWTSTCKTPGWFGCNDETTTTIKSQSTPPQATPTKTSTTAPICETPGWFGCNDPKTSSPNKSAPTSSDCQTPGFFFGCHDETSAQTTISHPITSPPTMPTSTGPSSATSSHSCTSSAWFGLICVDPSPTSTSSPTNPPNRRAHCVKRSWLGFCKEWSSATILKEEI